MSSNGVGAYNFKDNNNSFMSNQKPPFPSNMYPFLFQYPPPAYPNPYGLPDHKNTQIPMTAGPMGLSPYPMPPPGYPGYPMMYPPPPHPYYSYPDPRMQYRQMQQPLEASFRREPTPQKSESKKNQRQKCPLNEKSKVEIIVLSDNQSNNEKREVKVAKKEKKKIEKSQDKEYSNEYKLRRPIRKITLSTKVDSSTLTGHLKEKKKQIKAQETKAKITREEEKEIKVMIQSLTDTPYEGFNRNVRSKILSAKDGRGKIMIGDEFQASVPNYMLFDQNYSLWSDDKKKSLLSRIFK